MQIKLSEKQIEDGCLDYLAARQIFAWKTKSVGTYDAKINNFRKTSKRYRKGVADIIALWKGRAIAIEVKRHDGTLSNDQISFLREFVKSGGLAIVIRSVEELERELNLIGRGHQPTLTEYID